MARRPDTGRPTLLAVGISAILLCAFGSIARVADARAAVTQNAAPRTALSGFVKNAAMAEILGELLFRDTVDVMSDESIQPAVSATAGGLPNSSHDTSAVGRVARAVLAHRGLDDYLWLIQQAYDHSLWRDGDRSGIKQHFPLIWRTSIMLYEATLNASPHRVRICTPTEEADSFDCRDEIERARIVPIPSHAPTIGSPYQPVIG